MLGRATIRHDTCWLHGETISRTQRERERERKRDGEHLAWGRVYTKIKILSVLIVA